MPNSLEFHISNGGKYPFVPRRDQLAQVAEDPSIAKSIFITTPNKYYDDTRGQRLFEDFLDLFAFEERLGFDGALILEQHGGPNALVGQAIIMAAAAISRTQRMQIGTVGAIINSYRTPQRFAEEVATLDLLSNGRYYFGLPMGIGMNYHGLGMNPTYAREQLAEGHEFIRRAFTEDGPFPFHGKFYNAEYVNLWPKPLQKPYPEIWLPGGGSKETIEFAGTNGYAYLAVLVPWPVLLRNIEGYKEAYTRNGREWDPRKIVANTNIYVAETDKQARLEVEAHMMSMNQNSFGSPFHDNFPPGYTSLASLRGNLQGGYRSKDRGQMSYQDYVDEGQFIVGSPSTVAERLEEMTTRMGAGRVVVGGDTFTQPNWMTRKSLTLFAEEVMPRFRPAGGRPVWDRTTERVGFRTLSEYGARVGDPQWIPSARIEGVEGHVDIRTAHIPELRVPID